MFDIDANIRVHKRYPKLPYLTYFGYFDRESGSYVDATWASYNNILKLLVTIKVID